VNLASLPFEIEHLPQRQPTLGCFIILSSVILVIAVTIGGAFLIDKELIPLWIGFPSFIAVILFVGLSCVRINDCGKRLRQSDVLTVLARDSRAPVLFFRSFADEDIIDLTQQTLKGNMRRAEETICEAFQDIGPVIAIGRPGERLPELGAARMYVNNNNWQSAVRFFIQHSSVIVFIVGHSPGVKWEIETALEESELASILFFFPYMENLSKRRTFRSKHQLKLRIVTKKVLGVMERERHERYRLFKKQIESRLVAALPLELGPAQFLDFLDDGTPRLLKTIRPALLDTLLQVSLNNRRIGINIQRTLQPFLKKVPRLGLKKSSNE
jgi:hypothetical protein